MHINLYIHVYIYIHMYCMCCASKSVPLAGSRDLGRNPHHPKKACRADEASCLLSTTAAKELEEQRTPAITIAAILLVSGARRR